MGTLSLCADSARPPGTTTHQSFSNGLCTTAGNKSYGQKTHTSAQTPCHVVNTVTSYYHKKHLSTSSGLHVISALAHPFNNSTATRQLIYWDLLFILFCSIATLFNPSNRKSTRNRERPMKRRRQKYPCAKTPGSRPKHGKTNELWNVVYDPATDQVLTWSSERI